jgi:predicted metal-dependent hydrolase
MAEPREPTLDPEERRALAKGVREFNDGYYFECHDTLEDLWSGLRGDARDFFQGLIQVAVGYYHLGNDNPSGARSMFERALQRFEKVSRRAISASSSSSSAGSCARCSRASMAAGALRPRWRFDDPASAGP